MDDMTNCVLMDTNINNINHGPCREYSNNDFKERKKKDQKRLYCTFKCTFTSTDHVHQGRWQLSALIEARIRENKGSECT